MSKNFNNPIGLVILLFVLTLSRISPAKAQDDLLQMLEAEQSKDPIYTIATFKATRLINGQTVETISRNHLNFWISHRFAHLRVYVREGWMILLKAFVIAVIVIVVVIGVLIAIDLIRETDG